MPHADVAVWAAALGHACLGAHLRREDPQRVEVVMAVLGFGGRICIQAHLAGHAIKNLQAWNKQQAWSACGFRGHANSELANVFHCHITKGGPVSGYSCDCDQYCDQYCLL